MTNLEQYLNNATRGIWGKRKLEIREELEAHILENARKYEITGFTPDQSVTKVLGQLGNPRTLSFGFWEVYVVMQRQLMLGSLMVVMLFSIATWQATIQRDFKFSCASANQSQSIEGNKTTSWLNAFFVARELEKVDFTDFTMEKVKTTATDSGKLSSMYSEAESGQFRTTNQKYVDLRNPKLTVQTAKDKGSNKLHCKW